MRRSCPRSMMQLTFLIEFLNVFKAKRFLAELHDMISERASSDKIKVTASLFLRQQGFKIDLLEDSSFKLNEFLRTRDSANVLTPRSVSSRAEKYLLT